jgi:hypothetical protein
MNLLDSLDSLLEGGLVGALMLTCFAAGLLPLRRLVGWRLDFDASHYQHLRGRRGQVGLLDLAGLSCGLAVPLMIIRLLDEYSASGTNGQWLSIFAALAAVAATAAPVSYLVLAWRHPIAVMIAAAGWILLISWTHSLLALWIKDLDIVGGAITDAGLTPQIAVFHAGVATTCMATFAMLRLFGLKLLVVPLPAPAPSGRYVAFSSVSATVI